MSLDMPTENNEQMRFVEFDCLYLGGDYRLPQLSLGEQLFGKSTVATLFENGDLEINVTSASGISSRILYRRPEIERVYEVAVPSRSFLEEVGLDAFFKRPERFVVVIHPESERRATIECRLHFPNGSLGRTVGYVGQGNFPSKTNAAQIPTYLLKFHGLDPRKLRW